MPPMPPMPTSTPSSKQYMMAMTTLDPENPSQFLLYQSYKGTNSMIWLTCKMIHHISILADTPKKLRRLIHDHSVFEHFEEKYRTLIQTIYHAALHARANDVEVDMDDTDDNSDEPAATYEDYVDEMFEMYCYIANYKMFVQNTLLRNSMFPAATHYTNQMNIVECYTGDKDGTQEQKYCVIKTHWIRLIQRTWRNILRNHKESLLSISRQRLREISTKHSYRTPTIRGMLACIVSAKKN